MRCALCCAAEQYSGAGAGMCYAVACCATHMINYFRRKCKLCLGTIYCVFQLKIAHFNRFEHNILWLQKKIQTSYKKLYKITAYFYCLFVLFVQNTANMLCHALCAVLRRRLCVAWREPARVALCRTFCKRPVNYTGKRTAHERQQISRFSQHGDILCNCA